MALITPNDGVNDPNSAAVLDVKEVIIIIIIIIIM